MRSIIHAPGSGSPTAQAFPRARVVPSGRFSTCSFRRYQVSGFQAKGSVFSSSSLRLPRFEMEHLAVAVES